VRRKCDSPLWKPRGGLALAHDLPHTLNVLFLSSHTPWRAHGAPGVARSRQPRRAPRAAHARRAMVRVQLPLLLHNRLHETLTSCRNCGLVLLLSLLNISYKQTIYSLNISHHAGSCPITPSRHFVTKMTNSVEYLDRNNDLSHHRSNHSISREFNQAAARMMACEGCTALQAMTPSRHRGANTRGQ
jgi:hypothetical protein